MPPFASTAIRRTIVQHEDDIGSDVSSAGSFFPEAGTQSCRVTHFLIYVDSLHHDSIHHPLRASQTIKRKISANV